MENCWKSSARPVKTQDKQKAEKINYKKLSILSALNLNTFPTFRRLSSTSILVIQSISYHQRKWQQTIPAISRNVKRVKQLVSQILALLFHENLLTLLWLKGVKTFSGHSNTTILPRFWKPRGVQEIRGKWHTGRGLEVCRRRDLAKAKRRWPCLSVLLPPSQVKCPP